MFKKEFQTNNLNKMSNKDKNRLKYRLTACLRTEAVETIANNCKDLWTKKIQGTKGILYLNGDMPILVDPTDHGDFFPTLQLLTIQPMLLPCVVMNEGVEAYILKGANLMWPGVATKWFEVFNYGMLVSIVTSKGLIVGVGAMKGNEKTYMTGVACTLLHFYDDGVWRQQCKGLSPPQLPKLSVILQYKPKEEKEVYKQEYDDGYSEEEGSEPDYLTPEYMSYLFEYCLLTTMSLNQPKKSGPIIELPMESGQFYSYWIKRACPYELKLDIQHSTFKKLSIFYEYMEKKGYLELKNKKQGNSTITQIVAIRYDHETLKEFKPSIGRMKADYREKVKSIALFPLELHKNLKFVELYNLRQLPFLFSESLYANRNNLYDYQGVIKLIRSFQDKQQNNYKKKGLMRIDLKEQPYLYVLFKVELNQRLFKVKQDNRFYILYENYKAIKEDVYVFYSSRKDFENRCLSTMETWTVAESEYGKRIGQPIKGSSKVIQIYTTFYRIKLVTWLCNLQYFIAAPKVDEHLTDFAKYLSQRFSCGATYNLHRGFMQIMVQGNAVKKLTKMLTEDYGLPEKNIESKEPVIKKKGKKK